MASKFMYITIKWKPGDVVFVDRKKVFVKDREEANARALSILHETATRTSVTHFGKSAQEVIAELEAIIEEK